MSVHHQEVHHIPEKNTSTIVSVRSHIEIRGLAAAPKITVLVAGPKIIVCGVTSFHDTKKNVLLGGCSFSKEWHTDMCVYDANT